MKSMYYDKNGKPIEGPNACLEWARQFENDPAGRIIKQRTTWLGFFVSTVWLGLDHSFGSGKPLIYESMVFLGHRSELDIERHHTREEAEKGHRRMFLRWSNPFFVLYRWIKTQGGWGI